MMWAFGFCASSCSWNGELPKWPLSSVPPAMMAAAASGCGKVCVILSRRANSLSPHCFATAICKMRACTETETAGKAMRSLSVKSARVFTLGLLLTK
ncbi:hypothetical protein D3C72_2204700 [compost metagenome]